MTRFVKGIGSLVVLTALLLGAPMLLLRVGRLDALVRLRLADLLAPIQATDLMLGLMTVAAWVAWLVVMASLVAEVVGVLSQGRLRFRVPGGGWVQPVMAALVFSVAAMAATPAAHARAAAPSAPPSTTSVAHSADPDASRHRPASEDASSMVVQGGHPAGVVSHSAPGQEPAGDPGAVHRVVHTVTRGDDLWSIAEKYYGDGLQWRRIAADNHLDPSVQLPVGRVLHLDDVPASPVARQGLPPHHPSVTVAPGDTLSEIAQDELGDADRWPEIQHANKAVVRDADEIDVGWRLTMPQPSSHTRPSVPPGNGEVHRQAHPRTPNRTPGTVPSGAPGVPSSSGSEAGGVGRASASASPAAPTVPAEVPVGRVPSGDAPSGTRAPATTPTATTPAASLEPTAEDSPLEDPSLEVAIGLGSLLAAGLGAALVRRRRQQLAHRSMGRRIVLPSPEAAHLGSTLAKVAAEHREVPEDLAPDAVVMGEREAGPVVHALEDRVTWVAGDPVTADSMLAAIATALCVQPWSTDATVVVQGELPWITSLDEPQVRVVSDLEAAVGQLEREVVLRRGALAQLLEADDVLTLQGLRADPDRWDAWAPTIFVLSDEVAVRHRGRLLELLAGDSVGVGVVARGSLPVDPDDKPVDPDEMPTGDLDPHAGHSTGGHESWVEVSADCRARLDSGEPFVPHLLDPSARRTLAELFDVAGSDETTDAPWWSHDATLPPNLTVMTRRVSLHADEEEPVEPSAAHQPTLLLLGPLDLLGCRGEAPARARRQLVEYCAWIQLNPGRTASMMARELLVAEGTRRSNLSRLRAWLGDDENGEPYLPDAYSGRIQLHPAVTSDWEQLELLTSGGVNRASTDALVDALRLVRGAPLADAAPGQWTWAEALRIDMASTIRDIAGVLADRALADQDHDLARWAAARGLRAAPNDEVLLCARLRTEHLAGNRPEVERLVLQVTRGARQLGVDLRDETVALLQEVMEGRRRATA